VEASLGVITSGSHVYDTVSVPCSDGWDFGCEQSRFTLYPSLVAGLGVNLGDMLGVAGQIEWIRLEQGESEWGVYAGIRAGSYLAFVGTAVLALCVAASLS